MSDLFLTGIGHLTTHDSEPIVNAVVKVENGSVMYAGPGTDAAGPGTFPRVECEGRAVLPGFVDSHTHLVFGGDRAAEFSMKMAGASYTDLSESGGGILSTVTATRNTAEADLFEAATKRVERMIAAGTTTVEIKSGYGLDLDTELMLLRVARRIGTELPVSVKATFLGAHALPAEFRSDRDGYIDLLIEEMLPAAAPLADYCDVFVEEGAFSVDEARRIFAAADKQGLRARVHADQLTHSGGAALAAEIGAVSADHLDHVTEVDAAALAAAGVIGVLVPGASYMMRSPQAPGSMLIRQGVTVALATDCNPGTSYLESMGMVIGLAVVEMGLTTEQAIHAATKGGALALGMEHHGTIRTGSAADLVVLDAPSPTHIPYRPATNLVWKTIKSGRVVAGDRVPG